MKKLYAMVSMLAVSAVAFSQNVVQENAAYIKSSQSIIKEGDAARNFGRDTAGWAAGSPNFAPEFAGVTGDVYNIGYTGGGYFYGVNVSTANFIEVAQGYSNLNAAPIKISQIIALFAGKEGVSGDATSKTSFRVYTMAPNSAHTYNGTTFVKDAEGPATQLAAGDFLFDNIDTAFLAFNIVTFNPPAITNGNFAVSVNFADAKGKQDTLGLLADGDGDDIELDYAFHKAGINNNWYVTDELASTPLNRNIAIFAVVDDITAVNEFVNGVKLMAVYPNPTANAAKIEYTLENTTKVRLDVMNTKGQNVYRHSPGEQAAGTYTVNIDVTDLAAGVYYYTLYANGSKLTKQLVVTK
jgi:hypothetical protein